jgi:hypothetical protein
MRRSNLAALLPAVLLAGCGNPGGFRHTASITVTRPGAFVELPLPVSVYARSVQPGLRDLRVVDSSGGRVSFALLNPRVAEAQQVEQAREVKL